MIENNSKLYFQKCDEIIDGGLRKKGYIKNNIKEKNLSLITIITVVCNAKNDIEKTISSVLNQTYSNIEYIIIDGKSTDGTIDIIKKYDDVIDYWISQKDYGIYDAMNKGIKLARGEYIGILNAGDIYFENGVQFVVDEILKQNYDYVFGSVKVDDKIISGIFKEKLKYRIQVFPSHSASFFVKRELHKELGLYDISFLISSDYDFIYKLLVNDYKGGYTNKEKLVGEFQLGGFSSKRVFRAILEEMIIRYNNKENKLWVLFLLFIKLVKNIKKF